MDREHWDAWAKKTLVKLLPANCPEGCRVSQLPREAARWIAWIEPSCAQQFVRSCFAPAGRTSHFAHSCPCFMAGCWAVQCGSNVKQISFDRFGSPNCYVPPVTSCKLSGWVWGHKSSEALMMQLPHDRGSNPIPVPVCRLAMLAAGKVLREAGKSCLTQSTVWMLGENRTDLQVT